MAWIAQALVNVHVTLLACPAWVTDASVIEESINTYPVATGVVLAHVYFDMTPLSGESRWTMALEIMNEIGAVGTD